MSPSLTHLTTRFFLLLAACQIIGGFAFASSIALPLYLLTQLLLGVAVFFDWRCLLPPGVLAARAEIPPTAELGDQIPITLSLSPADPSRKLSLMGRIQVHAPTAPSLVFERPVEAAVWSETKSVLIARFEARAYSLGFDRLEAVRVSHRSPLGLTSRRLELPLHEASLRVMPLRRDLSPNAFEQLASGQRLLVQGGRHRTRAQAADQFHSVRPYQFPDPIRHIDQKKTARTGKLMTRVFDSFNQHHLVLALDTGRGALGKVGESSKLDYYLSAALELAQHARRHQDRVSFFSFTRSARHIIRQTRHMESFASLYEGRAGLKATDEESEFGLLLPTVSRLSSQRSILVILTDATRASVQESLAGALAPLCRKHLVVVLGLLDEAYNLEQAALSHEAGSLTPETYARYFYSFSVQQSMAAFRMKASALGSATISVSEKDWMTASIRVYDALRASLGS
jgi:uncharacterized protein (DUF58 family)